MGEGSSDVVVENNFIHHITDKGISIGQNSTVFSKNNTMVECGQGFGIKDEGFASIEQTTFYNNANDIVAFEKNIGNGGGFVEAANNIFANTAIAPISVDETSDVQVSYSLSDTDTLLGNNVLLIDPLFKNPTQNDFQLQASSPAINTGMNVTGIIDLGTSSHLYSAEPSILISAIHYHPADTALAEFLEIYNPSAETINLNGYSFVDGILFTFPLDAVISSGEKIRIAKDISFYDDYNGQVFQWESGSLSNDGEQLILKNAFGIIVDHVRYNDKLPWPTEADGEGAFLELSSVDLDNHFGKNWLPNFETGVDEFVEEEESVVVFPNPTSDVLKLELKDHLGESVRVMILDSKGTQIMSKMIKEITSDIIEFDVSKYTSGTYYVNIQIGKGAVSTKCFVVAQN